MSITVPPVHFNPQNNHYVVVNAEMADNYNVGCHVDLTCTDKIVAFTTGVTLTYFDGNGQQLGTSKPFTLACGPAPLFNAAHTSGDFTDKAPNGTQRIMVAQVAANDFGPFIQTSSTSLRRSKRRSRLACRRTRQASHCRPGRSTTCPTRTRRTPAPMICG